MIYFNTLIFYSRSVLAPSPNNPIDPAATPCDLKTVRLTFEYENYFVLMKIYIRYNSCFNNN